MILFFPTPGYSGEPPVPGPELLIHLAGSIVVLSWDGPDETTWRIYSDDQPYFAPSEENFLAEVAGDNNFSLPVGEQPQFFRVTQVLD